MCICILVGVSISGCLGGDGDDCSEELQDALELKITPVQTQIQANSTCNVSVTLQNTGDCEHLIDSPSLGFHSLRIQVVSPNGTTYHYTLGITSAPKAVWIEEEEILDYNITVGGEYWDCDGCDLDDDDWFKFGAPGSYTISASYISGRADNDKVETAQIESNSITINVI